MSDLLQIPDVENARHVGQRLWFEYHCWEKHSAGLNQHLCPQAGRTGFSLVLLNTKTSMSTWSSF
jgi:hypothetical protein